MNSKRNNRLRSRSLKTLEVTDPARAQMEKDRLVKSWCHQIWRWVQEGKEAQIDTLLKTASQYGLRERLENTWLEEALEDCRKIIRREVRKTQSNTASLNNNVGYGSPDTSVQNRFLIEMIENNFISQRRHGLREALKDERREAVQILLGGPGFPRGPLAVAKRQTWFGEWRNFPDGARLLPSQSDVISVDYTPE